MAGNGQLDDSARAVQYLNLGRFLNSHLHAEDQHLRPPQSPTPLTEAESRARMATIIGSMVLDTPSKQG
ncbi:hypothetical protein F4820DRAFT_89023 [Hypoxylon rubiginosum]|uniref:Uncharacterized protein n=1 Tax=Hypoxylon rubiginosum TaxID=110542 RepID=A0ACB9ZB89_9PEZI|nr:hypothetical protein F4820DRAFT_89023 [Hypoxylon rubiginosum]